MKTTVVPAQITTVEDKVAGNLSFTQIILLILPLITSTAIYVVIPHHDKLNAIKIVLIALQFMVFGGLCLRIKGKVVMDWLLVYLRFAARPRIYIYTKADMIHRDIVQAPLEEKVSSTPKKEKAKEEIPTVLNFSEHLKLSELLANKGLTIGFTQAEKGGINVSIKAQS